MAGIISTNSLVSFNSRQAIRDMHGYFTRILKDAVRAWVAVAEDIIPVWSGASRGTLLQLAQQVEVDVSIFPVQGAPNQIDFGIVHTESRLIIVPGRYGFKYLTDLFHLVINEQFDVRDFPGGERFQLHKFGPYNFREQADEALREVFIKGVQSLPIRQIISDNLKTRTVRT